MENIKTYEGFLDVFKKRKSIKDIHNVLWTKINQDTQALFFNRHTTYDILSYGINIYTSMSRSKRIGDYFKIKLSGKKKLDCEIIIRRIYNNSNGTGDENIPFISVSEIESTSMCELDMIEKNFEINPFKKIDEIVNEIFSNLEVLYDEFKFENGFQSNELIEYLIDLDEESVNNNKKFLNSQLELKKLRDDYIKSLADEVDNIEDMVNLYLKDDCDNVKINTKSLDNEIFLEITGDHLPEKPAGKVRPFGLKVRMLCNEFINRFISEYGDEYEIDIDIKNNKEFYITIRLGEFPDELKDKNKLATKPRFDPNTGNFFIEDNY